MSRHLVTLLLGSNLGDCEKNLANAVELIEKQIGTVEKKTEILRTVPVEFVSINVFCNIAMLIKTQHSPVHLLKHLKKIEHLMGREVDSSGTNEYTDRIIDIDIVLYGNLHFESESLQIPHVKHLFQREFSGMLLHEINCSNK